MEIALYRKKLPVMDVTPFGFLFFFFPQNKERDKIEGRREGSQEGQKELRPKPLKSFSWFLLFLGGGRDYPKVRDFSPFEALLV